MRRLLSSWLLFAAVWIPAHAVVAALVERRIALTQAAFWSGALIPLVQAIAVESLARPLVDSSWRALPGAIARSGSLRLLWGATAIAFALHLSTLSATALGPAGSIAIAPLTTALFLMIAVALLTDRAWRRRSWPLATSAALALLVAGAIAAPAGAGWLARWPGPPAAARLVTTAAASVVGALLFLALSKNAPEPGARFFDIAAGAAIGAGVARAIPVTLGIPLDATRALPVHLLLTVAAAAAASGALCLDRTRGYG